MAEFRALHEKYQFAPRLYSRAARSFCGGESFRRSTDAAQGRAAARLDLESYDYETGTTPRIAFGPNRRVGAAGAHVVSIDIAENSPLRWLDRTQQIQHEQTYLFILIIGGSSRFRAGRAVARRAYALSTV